MQQKLANHLEVRSSKLSSRVILEEGRLHRVRSARLVLGFSIFAVVLMYSFFSNWWLQTLALFFLVVAFGFLVRCSRRLQNFIGNLRAAADFYRRQSLRRQGLPVERNWQALPTAIRENGLVLDLGLVGPHSLFTFIDETISREGAGRLVDKWLGPPQSAEQILKRQHRIRDLADRSRFWIRFFILGERTKNSSSTEMVLNILSRPIYDGQNRNIWLAWILWLVGIGVIIFGALAEISTLKLFFLIYSLPGLWVLGQVRGAFQRGEGLTHHMQSIVPIFKYLEQPVVFAALDAEIPTIRKNGPAEDLRRLQRATAFLGTEANPIFHFLLNGFVPWTVTASWNLERVRRQMADRVPKSLQELHELEATASLVCLYLFQSQTFPKINSLPGLKAEQIFHPLIKALDRQANDFEFPTKMALALMTGSNMSGKSTFLRTVGVNQVLALAGAPVFAEEFLTWPARLQTCIQVSDSMRDGYSYFYSEVRRLKKLIDAVQSTEPILYLIDEIFRGTNNLERHIGSKAVIRSLLAPSAMGFVSTHDLELTGLATNDERIVNVHFRDDVKEGKMHFSYKLHFGPCPTTNALRIMEIEGIPVPALMSGLK